MYGKRKYIDLRAALKNYLKEQGITLQDLLSSMDEDKEGIMDALRKRVYLTENQSRILEEKLTSKQLNLRPVVIHGLYIV